jgi:16S rRNA (cytosine1402-N4)-methyltransferase
MEQMNLTYHNPVLLQPSIEGLNINAEGVYVDVTFGGGGHSREIIKHLSSGKLFGFDQDSDAQQNVIQDDRFSLIPHNFKFLSNFLNFNNILEVDGILADLGVSSHQFDVPERGFSIRFNGPLDLRMDTRKPKTAADVVNNYSEEELANVLYYFGELKESRKISRAICTSRSTKNIETVEELLSLLNKYAPRGKENSFFARIFQALRIEVNEEIEVLKSMLQQSEKILKPGGRLVVISYHSIEDRIVKNFFKTGNFEGILHKDMFGNKLTPFINITRKPIIPNEEETKLNNRARSAKLRIAEKK